MARSFLRSTDFDRNEINQIFEISERLKTERSEGHDRILKGQSWALIFQKSSTRTRVSFEVGIQELGGYPLYLDQGKTQMGRGETVADTARVLSRFIHGIVIRTYDHSVVEELAREGDVPVINALTDLLHPCQIYSDAFTLSEHWRSDSMMPLDSLAGKKIAFYGDCASNMAHSWILGAAHLGMRISLSGPTEYRPEPVVDRLLKEAGYGADYEFSTDPLAAAEDADVIYTDVWVSMGDESEKEARLNRLQPYQVNARIMEKARPGALFMHCLPAHEGEEVSSEVYQSKASIVYQQAENRLHAQKGLLVKLTESN